jgi:hypothetical protein
MQLKAAYAARRIHFVEHCPLSGWQLKIYSILYRNKVQNDALIDAAKHVAGAFLPQPAVTDSHYGVGFISVHQGQSYDFVTVAYWAYDTELRYQSYMRPSSSSYALTPVTAGELSSDVWDLALLAFERDAWVKWVLTADSPQLKAYLQETLSAEL